MSAATDGFSAMIRVLVMGGRQAARGGDPARLRRSRPDRRKEAQIATEGFAAEQADLGQGLRAGGQGARARARARPRPDRQAIRCQSPPGSAATWPSSSSAVSAASDRVPPCAPQRADQGVDVGRGRGPAPRGRPPPRGPPAGDRPAAPVRRRATGSRARRGCPAPSRPASRRRGSAGGSPWRSGEWIEPGNAKTSRPCSAASRAVMSEPDDSVASTTSTPRARPLMRRLRRGKVRRARRRARRKFRHERAARRERVREVAVARGIDAVEAGADDRERCCRRCASAPRWAAASMPSARPLTMVSPPAASARREGFGIARALRRRVAAAHDRERRAGQQLAAAEAVEHRRRVGRSRAARAGSRHRPRRRAMAPGSASQARVRASASAVGGAEDGRATTGAGTAARRCAGVAASTASGLPKARSRRDQRARRRCPQAAARPRLRPDGSMTVMDRPRAGLRVSAARPRAARARSGLADESPTLIGSVVLSTSANDTRSNTRKTNSSPVRSSGDVDPAIRLIRHRRIEEAQDDRSGSLDGRGSGIGGTTR